MDERSHCNICINAYTYLIFFLLPFPRKKKQHDKWEVTSNRNANLQSDTRKIFDWFLIVSFSYRCALMTLLLSTLKTEYIISSRIWGNNIITMIQIRKGNQPVLVDFLCGLCVWRGDLIGGATREVNAVQSGDQLLIILITLINKHSDSFCTTLSYQRQRH